MFSLVTMETPVPGPVPVGADVTAQVDDIIRRQRWVDKEGGVREETPDVQGH